MKCTHQINIVNPDHSDVSLSEQRVSVAWLSLEQAMLTDCRDGPSRSRKNAANELVYAMDVNIHVCRKVYRQECEENCWVCKKATDEHEGSSP